MDESRFPPRFGITADVECIDILQRPTLGAFDVVYSWGVLHHTEATRDAAFRSAGCSGQGAPNISTARQISCRLGLPP